MRPDIESRLSKAMNADEVRAVLTAACAEYGQVVRTGIICSADEQPPRRAVDRMKRSSGATAHFRIAALEGDSDGALR